MIQLSSRGNYSTAHKSDRQSVGATTENPSFELIAPLLSRSRVLVFKPLELEIKDLLMGKRPKRETTIEEGYQEAQKILTEKRADL